jgi:hypothetical protein
VIVKVKATLALEYDTADGLVNCEIEAVDDLASYLARASVGDFEITTEVTP